MKRYKVTYRDAGGTSQETRPMSLAEANENKLRLAVQPVDHVTVVPASQPTRLDAHETAAEAMMRDSRKVAARLAGLGIVRLGGDPLDLSLGQWERLLDLAEAGQSELEGP